VAFCGAALLIEGAVTMQLCEVSSIINVLNALKCEAAAKILI